MTEERNYEAEALQQGWKPKDQFEGPEGKFTDAKTFVEKGEKITGILKSRLDRQEAQIQELRDANKEFGKYQKELRDAERKKAEARISELEQLRATAITDGDGTEFTRVDKEIQRTRKQLDEPPVNTNGLDPLAQEWLNDNDWYNTNRKLKIFADGLSDIVVAEGYQGKAYYSELSRRVREEFPNEFKNPKRQGASTVEDGGEIETGGSSKAQTYDNLPSDAKAACDRYVANGLISKEEYVKTFEWDE